jgi:hypothetical protein
MGRRDGNTAEVTVIGWDFIYLNSRFNRALERGYRGNGSGFEERHQGNDLGIFYVCL